MTIRMRQCGAAVAAAVALTACTGDATDPAQFLPPTGHSGDVRPGGPAPPDDPEAQQRRAGRSRIELGNLGPKPKTAQELGAPWDPCALAWNDFPETVRPTDNRPTAPERMKITDQSVGDVECVYDNSERQQVDLGGGRSGWQTTKPFKVIASWVKDGTADPSKRPGSTPRTWGSRSGFTLPAPPPPEPKPGHPPLGEGCTGAVGLQHPDGRPGGAAMVMVADARFDMPVCDIALAIAGAIAAKNQ